MADASQQPADVMTNTAASNIDTRDYKKEYTDLKIEYTNLDNRNKYLIKKIQKVTLWAKIVAGTIAVGISVLSCWRLVVMVLEESKMTTQQAIVLSFVVLGYCAILGALLNFLGHRDE